MFLRKSILNVPSGRASTRESAHPACFRTSRRRLSPDRFNQCLVKFGVLPVHFKADFFSTRHCQIPNDARKLVQHIANWLHASLHHACLQFRCQEIEPLYRSQKSVVLVTCAVLKDLVSCQNKFPNKRHELVQQSYVDSDTGIGNARVPGFDDVDGN